MTRRLPTAFALALSAALVAIQLPALAETPAAPEATKPPNLMPEGTGNGATRAPGGARILTMAQELFEIGRAQKDALTVLAAARLAGSVTLQNGSSLRVDRKGEAAADDGAVKAHPPLADAPAMLALARELAGDDDLILSLIEDAEVEGSRGRVGGAIQRLALLPGGLTDVWEVPFYGASQSEVAVIGDGDTNLDVLITDDGGNTICFDVSASDKMMCDFVPAENGYFYVNVQNKGEAKNSYYLLTN